MIPLFEVFLLNGNQEHFPLPMIRIITLILILIDYFDDFVFVFINSNLMIWEFLNFDVNNWEYNAHWLHHILVFEELQRLELDVLRV